MADAKQLLSVLERPERNPIGQIHSYVAERKELSETIDSSQSNAQNTRVPRNSSIYKTSENPVIDLTGLEDEDDLGEIADVKSSVSYLPRLSFLDSDENISAKNTTHYVQVEDSSANSISHDHNSVRNDIEIREQRSVSDSIVVTGDRLGVHQSHQNQGGGYKGYINRLSQVSVQSSDSDLLTDHVVMDTDQTLVKMTPLKRAQTAHVGDETWHCHMRNSKIPPDKMARNQLIIVSILCFLFMVGEAVGGALSNSLALFTDVLHLGSDLISFLVSLLALYLSKKPATKTMSFGYHRAEVLGALVSVFIIWSVTVVLIYMAIERIVNEHYKDVKADEMLITAILGVVFNFVMGIVLHSELCCKRSTISFGHNHSHGSNHSHNHSNHAENHNNHSNLISRRSSDGSGEDREPLLDNENDSLQDQGTNFSDSPSNNSHPKNINVRAAFIHVVGDIIQSIGVLISSLIIKLRPEDKFRLADPICTFLFSILVLFTTITVLRDTLQIIMEGVPRGFNYFSIKTSLQNIEGVQAVHGLTVWCLTLEKNALAVHLAVGPNINHKKVLQEASEYLHRYYNFVHTTIQVEDYTPLTAQCHDCQELHK